MGGDIKPGQQRERNIEDLITALKEGDSATQWTAAEALGELGDLRAVDPLITILNAEHWRVRCHALKALGKLGDTRAVDPLIATLKHVDRNTRVAAAEALGELGDLRAVDPLTAALKQEQDEVFEAIAKALEKLSVSPELIAAEKKSALMRRRVTLFERVDRAWDGEEPLWLVYWVYGMLFSIICAVIFYAIAFALTAATRSLEVLLIPGIFSLLFTIPYAIWISVSTWRCARNSHVVFKVLARISVIIGPILVLLSFTTIHFCSAKW